jgi:hypothetical protein
MEKCNFWCINCNCRAPLKEQSFTFEVEKKDGLKIDDNDISNVSCPNNEELYLKLMGHVTGVAIIDPKVHAKGRTPKEKESRRINDFIKNTLPTLGKSDKQHFTKKFEKKGYKIKDKG